jgi:hypothetical protein
MRTDDWAFSTTVYFAEVKRELQRGSLSVYYYPQHIQLPELEHASIDLPENSTAPPYLMLGHCTTGKSALVGRFRKEAVPTLSLSSVNSGVLQMAVSCQGPKTAT